MAFDSYSIRYFIKEHGITMTLRQRTQGSYNSTTGTVANTTTDYQTVGFSFHSVPYDLQQKNSVVVASRQIIFTSLQVNGSALPKPKVNDQVIISGFTHDILKVQEVKSANNVIIYVVDVKG